MSLGFIGSKNLNVSTLKVNTVSAENVLFSLGGQMSNLSDVLGGSGALGSKYVVAQLNSANTTIISSRDIPIAGDQSLVGMAITTTATTVDAGSFAAQRFNFAPAAAGIYNIFIVSYDRHLPSRHVSNSSYEVGANLNYSLPRSTQLNGIELTSPGSFPFGFITSRFYNGSGVAVDASTAFQAKIYIARIG